MKQITLISHEGVNFEISLEVACVSPVLKAMLESPFQEKKGQITLPNISHTILAKVVEYLQYNLKYKDANDEDIPNFEIPPEMSLELLIAADYLNV